MMPIHRNQHLLRKPVIIEVQCPSCSKKFRAKEKLAGKRVKCPNCANPFEIPPQVSDPPVASVSDRAARQEQASQQLHQDLLKALDKSDFDKVAVILRHYTLWMVNADEDLDSAIPLIANVEECDALVVFTSPEYLAEFAPAVPELCDEGGALPAFAVEGPNVFEHSPHELGMLVNPETEFAMLLDPDCVQQIRSRLAASQSDQASVQRPTVHVEMPTPQQRDAAGDPRAVALRRDVMSTLNELGFYPAEWLPLAQLDRSLRPKEEIAGRLLALAGLFAWASAPEEALSSEQLRSFFETNQLRPALTMGEREIVDMPRAEAFNMHSGTVGWRLENMWPLAWTLGYQQKPVLEASQIGQDVIDGVLFQFVGGFGQTIEGLLEKSQLRSASAVNSLEDLFYCAHNAVRSAQFGSAEKSTVPDGFDPIGHGGVVHERRHSLTWCLSPGVQWDDTDLST